MRRFISLLVLVLAVSVSAQAFAGRPAGGATGGKTMDFPDCAKTCIDTPKGNFVDTFKTFCNALPTTDCCITHACPEADKKMTYQISRQICNYIGVKVPTFTCAPIRKITPDVAPSSSHSQSGHSTTQHSISKQSTLSPSTHSTHPTSTHSTSSPSTRSTHLPSTQSTLSTSTRLSPRTTHTPTSTIALGGTSLNSNPSPIDSGSRKASSTSAAPSSSHSTLSVYNGFVGASCYTEGTSGHALTGNSTSSPSMTIETCLDFCEKTGWGWAGLENSSDCYCGYEIVNGGAQTASSACDLGCAGNPSENCGGKKALSVYESG